LSYHTSQRFSADRTIGASALQSNACWNAGRFESGPIGLTLSLRRLAEESRIAGEARERAERLEATVKTLAHELERRGSSRIVGNGLAPI
jgi:hypothetical protein